MDPRAPIGRLSLEAESKFVTSRNSAATVYQVVRRAGRCPDISGEAIQGEGSAGSEGGGYF